MFITCFGLLLNKKIAVIAKTVAPTTLTYRIFMFNITQIVAISADASNISMNPFKLVIYINLLFVF
ncbi:hypothetical protein VCRA2117O328_10198 [Vibrio crassostreae]|nr:hypothetical protein VCRA2117O328_10198 [Vibrio crassostreae]